MMIYGEEFRRLYLLLVFLLGFVEVIAGGKFFVFGEMAGAERLGNGMLFAQPFAEINELATMRTEWAVRSGEPLAFFLAGRTFVFANGCHQVVRSRVTS